MWLQIYLDLWLRVRRRVAGAVRVAPASEKLGHFVTEFLYFDLKQVTSDYYLNIKLLFSNIQEKMQSITIIKSQILNVCIM